MQAATEKIRDVPAGAECHVAQFGYDEAQTQTRSTGRVRGEALRYMRHRKPRLQRGYEREQETGKQCKAVPTLRKQADSVYTEPGNVKKCAVGKYPKSEKHGNTAQFSEVERSGTQENCGGIGSGCRLRLRPLPVLRRRQSQRVARIDPNAVVVDKNIAENDRFDLFSR